MSTRDALTRQAEKSLRQGRVDEAIAQYQELASLAPVDWGLVKQLADLLERAGQREGAAQQFARWADHLAAEGFHSKAAALYKKVLKLDASHEHALWHLGEVCIELKLRADARVAFQRVVDIRLRRGDAAGAAAAHARVVTLAATPAPMITVPQTPPAYASAAPTQAPLPATVSPPLPSPQTPEDVFGREAGAEPCRGRLLDILDREGVADPHRVLVDLLVPASDILADGDEPPADPTREDEVGIGRAGAALEGLGRVAPPPPSVPVELAAALPAPAATPAFDWADLLGRHVDAHTVHAPAVPVEEAQALPPLVEAVSAPPGGAPVESSPDVDLAEPDHVSSAADASLGLADLRVQPMCADDAPLQPSFTMPRGWLSEAAPLAADDIAHRRAPEDDFFFADDATPPRWAPPAVRASGQVSQEPMASVQPAPVAIEAVEVPVATGDATPLIEEEVDLTHLLEELKQWDPVLPEPRQRPPTDPPTDPPPDAPASPGLAPIPLPDVADLMTGEVTSQHEEAPIEDVLAEHRAVPGAGSAELEAVFADMQRHSDGYAVAEQQLAAGRVFLAAGLASEAARAFERASVEPRSRFAGSLALAELHKSHGQLVEAVSWYEHAAAAPVPDAAVKRPVLYDLAESLEALGETDRALGVLLDLLSQVEDYRDARARLDRLLRVDAGG